MRRAINDPKTMGRAAANLVFLHLLTNAISSSSGGGSSGRGLTFAEMAGTLREARTKQGNFGMGKATSQEAVAMGEAWVGPGYRVASNGKTMISADGLKQFRPPSLKPQLSKEQANFEWRRSPGGPWVGNGHLDIK